MIESKTIVGTGMKVVTQRDELAQKLGVVARAVSTRASVQILSGVLLRAEGGRLHLAATDMELSLRSSLDAQIEGEGSVVVPGRLLVDLVRPRHSTRTHPTTFRGCPISTPSARSQSIANRCSTPSRVSHAPHRVTSRARC